MGLEAFLGWAAPSFGAALGFARWGLGSGARCANEGRCSCVPGRVTRHVSGLGGNEELAGLGDLFVLEGRYGGVRV